MCDSSEGQLEGLGWILGAWQYPWPPSLCFFLPKGSQLCLMLRGLR